MLFKNLQYIYSFYYFKKSQYAHFLSFSPQNEHYLNKKLWAYYNLHMYKSVCNTPYEINHKSDNSFLLITFIVSSAACGHPSQQLIQKFEENYPYLINQLVENLSLYDYQTALYLSKKYSIKSLCVVALLIRNQEFNTAKEVLSVCNINKEQEWNNFYLLKFQLCKETHKKMNYINKIFKQENLCELKLKNDNINFTIPNISSEHNLKKIKNYGLVSILITAYNSSKYIKSTISSLLAQTYQNIELIIIDDCSTDSTWEIIQHFCRQDPRIKAYQQPVNAGTYVAKNRALLFARGEFVMCHDADDWSHPQRIELQLQPLIKNPKLVSTISNWIRVADDGNIFARSIYPLNRLNPSSPLFRRKIVMEKIGFWDSVRTGADSEFLHRLKLQFGQKSVLKISPPLAIGAHHENSLMNAPETGFTSQSIPVDRLDYWESWCQWHIDTLKTKQSLYLAPFSVQNMRKFDSPTSLLIPDQTLIYYQSLTQNDLCDSEQK